MSELEEIIKKHVLKNAHDYGSANPGSIAGKVIAEYPDAKNDMKLTMKEIGRIIQEVSSMSKQEIKSAMSSYTYIKKKEEQKGIELEQAIGGQVKTRFPPEPSGYPHIGHAKAAFLNREAANRYNGKMVLRFDDTNPEKESIEYINAITDGLKWLGIEWDELTYTSDNLEEIYKSAEYLIRGGKAYVTTSSRDDISQSRRNSTPLPERNDSPEENLGRWKKMLNGNFGPGEALLLYKGDLESDNTVMRDPALARIIEKTHYRQGDKYRVWPGYDLAVVFMDNFEGITHPMRSKEYELRDELYYSLFDSLGWKPPVMTPFARLAIKNALVSKRLITPLVSQGKVEGWDDPRLPTLAGLRRRGIIPEAIKNFVLAFGLSKVESEPDWEALLSENRKLLDATSPHYFFVPDPIKVMIKGFDGKNVKLRLNPKTELGMRELFAGNSVFISRNDAKKLTEGEIFRLKDLCNAKLITREKNLLVCEYSGDQMVPKKLQWVPEENVDCTVIKPGDLLKDGNYDPESLVKINGLAEKNCLSLDVGSIIQFERFGFCSLDRKDNELTFIYSC
jgi:glutamyl-tRNA synthetase